MAYITLFVAVGGAWRASGGGRRAAGGRRQEAAGGERRAAGGGRRAARGGRRAARGGRRAARGGWRAAGAWLGKLLAICNWKASFSPGVKASLLESPMPLRTLLMLICAEIQEILEFLRW